MQRRLSNITGFCTLWAFFSIYASLIYLAAVIPGRGHSDVIAPSPLGLALVLGWLPAAIGAACIGLCAWLAGRFLPARLQLALLAPLLAALALWPFAYHYYQSHYSDAALYQSAYDEAMRVPPGGLARYMSGANRDIRRKAFLDNYGYRYSGRPPLDPRDVPVAERILSEEFAAFPDLSQAVARRYGSPGIYLLFSDLIAARQGEQSPAELFERWPPRLVVDALFAPENLPKLDKLAWSASDTAIIYDHSTAAAAEQDAYGAYGMIWLDLHRRQAGSLGKVFGHCANLPNNHDYCLRFAVERLAVEWRGQIADAAALQRDDAAALAKLLLAYFAAPQRFMPPETPMTLFRWIVLDALRTRQLTSLLEEWSAHRAELLEVLLSPPVLSRLQTQSDWTSGGRQALRQALAELPEPPALANSRPGDAYGQWLNWMSAQLQLLRPGRIEELFAFCRRLPIEGEQRLSCFRFIFDAFKNRQDFSGLSLADKTEHLRDFAAFAQGVEEMPPLTGHKGLQFDARLALYQLHKGLLRSGETAELLALTQKLDESGGYGVTYRRQTLQWLMAEAHAEPPRYRPDGKDRAAIRTTAETLGSQFKAQAELTRGNSETAMALGNAPEQAYREMAGIIAWVSSD